MVIERTAGPYQILADDDVRGVFVPVDRPVAFYLLDVSDDGPPTSGQEGGSPTVSECRHRRGSKLHGVQDLATAPLDAAATGRGHERVFSRISDVRVPGRRVRQ